MEIKKRKQDRCEVIDLIGEFDFLTAQDVKDQVVSTLESGIEQVVVNLEQLRYIDSTGLGILITLWTKAKEKNIILKYAGVKGSVEKVINLSRLHIFLPIVSSVDDAIREMQE